jgi:hypothetical protein
MGRRASAPEDGGMRNCGVRFVCYLVALGVGLALGANFLWQMVAVSMCNTFGGQCTATEEAEMRRLFGYAVISPIATVGIWAVIDLTAASWRNRNDEVELRD